MHGQKLQKLMLQSGGTSISGTGGAPSSQGGRKRTHISSERGNHLSSPSKTVSQRQLYSLTQEGGRLNKGRRLAADPRRRARQQAPIKNEGSTEEERNKTTGQKKMREKSHRRCNERRRQRGVIEQDGAAASSSPSPSLPDRWNIAHTGRGEDKYFTNKKLGYCRRQRRTPSGRTEGSLLTENEQNEIEEGEEKTTHISRERARLTDIGMRSIQ